MQVIHFTQGATDWLTGFSARRSRSVSLATGTGDTHLGCLHLMPGARIDEPPITHDCALLVVHGQVLVLEDVGSRVILSRGTGTVMKAGSRYQMESERGAIVLTFESKRLAATLQGISSPDRIAGQHWPGNHLQR